MHGEELVVFVGRKEMRFRESELDPHRTGEQACDEEEAKCCHNITNADRGVMDGLKPAYKTGWFTPDVFELGGLPTFGISSALCYRG